MNVNLASLEELFINVMDQVSDDPDLFECRSREGTFSPALTMWLAINGRAKGERALSAALQAIEAGEAEKVISRNSKSKRSRGREVSDNSGGLCRARQRLAIDKVKALSQKMNDLLINELTPQQFWNGKRVYLFDGTQIVLTRTKDTVKAYQPVRNQNGRAYTPNMLCVCCHELFSGIAINPHYGAARGPKHTSESDLFYKVMAEIPEGALLIADRNLGIFPVAYEAHRRGHQTLVRLTSIRAKSLCKAFVNSKEDVDVPVTWKFGTTKSKELEIPDDATVEGRFIKIHVRRRGYRTLELLFFTDLQEPADQIAALYLKREKIENDIRTLKHTIELERLYSKTPNVIATELVLGVLAYNLICAIIARAAKELGIPARQISFTNAARLIQIHGNNLRHAVDAQEQRRIGARFLKSLFQTRHPIRRRQRIEPRKLAAPQKPLP